MICNNPSIYSFIWPYKTNIGKPSKFNENVQAREINVTNANVINPIPVITEAQLSRNWKPDTRRTRLQDSRIASWTRNSSLLNPAVAISLISVSPQCSLGTLLFPNSRSSTNDPPDRFGSSAYEDKPGLTLIDPKPFLPKSNTGLPPPSNSNPNTWIRVPVLPPSITIPYFLPLLIEFRELQTRTNKRKKAAITVASRMRTTRLLLVAFFWARAVAFGRIWSFNCSIFSGLLAFDRRINHTTDRSDSGKGNFGLCRSETRGLIPGFALCVSLSHLSHLPPCCCRFWWWCFSWFWYAASVRPNRSIRGPVWPRV